MDSAGAKMLKKYCGTIFFSILYEWYMKCYLAIFLTSDQSEVSTLFRVVFVSAFSITI
jgi:hypothetical protein